jgi:GntR family transcriptional regulator
MHERESMRGRKSRKTSKEQAVDARSSPTKVVSESLGDPRVPLYVQAASLIRRSIETSGMAVGARLPSIEHYEGELGVARVTVRQAFELLRREGLVESRQGRGTFVTGSIERNRWLELGTDWTSLLAPIAENVPHRLDDDRWPAPEIRDEDGTPADAYVCLRSLQKKKGQPYAIARILVAKRIHARAPARFSQRVALSVIADMKGLDIASLHQSLVIDSADADTARRLGLQINAPIAEARIVVKDRAGKVIYLGEITYRGDCVHIGISLPGPGGNAKPAPRRLPKPASRAKTS